MDTSDDQLYQIVLEKDYSGLQNFLENGLDVNHVFCESETKNIHGYTLLHLAVSQHDLRVMKLLISQKANVNKAVQVVSFDGLTSRCRILHKDKLHRTCLYRAICLGHSDAVDLLVIAGADVNCQDRSGCTALWHAVDTNNEDLVERILKAPDCDIDASDNNLISPLFVGVLHQNLHTVQLLLGQGAVVDNCQYQNVSPLGMAASGKFEIVKELLQHGADPNIRNVDGGSPLTMAIRSGSPDTVIKALIYAGATLSSQECCLLGRNYETMKDNKDLADFIESSVLDNPSLLKVQCANCIRKILKVKKSGKSIFYIIGCLPLPKPLIDYIRHTNL